MRDKNNANKHELYFKAYSRTLMEYSKAREENLDMDSRDTIKKAIVYGVKVINTNEEPKYIDWETAQYDLQFAIVLKDLMSILTPKEFMQLYPIAKEYDGDKSGEIDYFYTRDYIKTLDQDKPIGDEIFNFIWEYHNQEITYFNLEIIEYMDRIRSLEGKTSLAEEFFNMKGIKTYTMHTDQNGTQFMIDNDTGKTTKLIKPKAKHLRVVK